MCARGSVAAGLSRGPAKKCDIEARQRASCRECTSAPDPVQASAGRWVVAPVRQSAGVSCDSLACWAGLPAQQATLTPLT